MSMSTFTMASGTVTIDGHQLEIVTDTTDQVNDHPSIPSEWNAAFKQEGKDAGRLGSMLARMQATQHFDNRHGRRAALARARRTPWASA